MTRFSLKDAQLRDLDVEAVLDEATALTLDAAIAQVTGELRTFEFLWNLSTEQMRAQVLSGQLQETEEICAWLMVDNRRRALTSTGHVVLAK